VQGESQQGNVTLEILTFVVLQALQEEIILNRIGKFIPYIFLEWGQLPNNKKNCKHFTKWVEHFYSGGYVPLDSAKMVRVNSTERDKKWDLVWAHTSVL